MKYMPFQKGNKCGQLASDMQKFRHAALKACTRKQVKALFKRYFALAMAGDVNAAKLILPYVLGKPLQEVSIGIQNLKLYDICMPLDEQGP